MMPDAQCKICGSGGVEVPGDVGGAWFCSLCGEWHYLAGEGE